MKTSEHQMVSGKIVDNSDSEREFFRDQIFEAIPAIRKKKIKDQIAKLSFAILQETLHGSFAEKMLSELLTEKVI